MKIQLEMMNENKLDTIVFIVDCCLILIEFILLELEGPTSFAIFFSFFLENNCTV